MKKKARKKASGRIRCRHEWDVGCVSRTCVRCGKIEDILSEQKGLV